MNTDKQHQVSLSGAARGTSHSAPKKKKLPVWVIPVAAGVLAVIILLTVLLGGGTKGPTLSSREMVEYRYTDDALVGDVSYYVVGVTGEDAESTLNAVGVLCFDRENDALSFIQLPVMTYIGADGNYATASIGNVWGNPQPVSFCPTCRCRVGENDKDGTRHKACGTECESRTGSAFTDLATIVNTQLGLPVDNYLLIPPRGLATLIDNLGGVDLSLDKKYSFNGTDYEPGVCGFSGEVAVNYVFSDGYNGTVETEWERLSRERKLMSALLSRLSQYKVGELYNEDKPDVLSDVMMGANPIRFDSSSFGKARLLGTARDNSAENDRYNKVLAEFLHDISRVDLASATVGLVPGCSAKKGTTTYYSMYPSGVRQLINEIANPQQLPVDETTAVMSTIVEEKPYRLIEETLDTVLAPQTTQLTASAETPAEEPETEEPAS